MAAKSPERRRLSSTVAAIERHNGPDDPRIPRLRVDLAVAQLAEQITDVVRADPAPTPAQRRTLALLLTGGGTGG